MYMQERGDILCMAILLQPCCNVVLEITEMQSFRLCIHVCIQEGLITAALGQCGCVDPVPA